MRTIEITLPGLTFHRTLYPLAAAAVIDAILQAQSQSSKDKGQHVGMPKSVIFSIGEETVDLLERDFLWHVREAARLDAALERVEIAHKLGARRQARQQDAGTTISTPERGKGVERRILIGKDIHSSWQRMGQ